MAGRPTKQGIDYFFFDVGFFEDIKVRKISRACGSQSTSILICLLCNIYRNDGYYILWDEDLPFVIADTVGVSEGAVKEVILKAIQVEFFSKEKYEQYKILTSHGIQKRFFQATYQRKETDVRSDFLINCTNNSINHANNSINHTDNETSRVKKSRVKKSINEPPLPPKGGIDKPKWKNDFEVYLETLRTECRKTFSDTAWMDQQKSFNPGVDIRKSIEKACVNYWATEAGWKKKKRSRITDIDWRSTFANAVSQRTNRVYEDSLFNSSQKDKYEQKRIDSEQRKLDSLTAIGRMRAEADERRKQLEAEGVI